MILISPSVNRGGTVSSAEPVQAGSAMKAATTTPSAMRDTLRPAGQLREVMASAPRAAGARSCRLMLTGIVAKRPLVSRVWAPRGLDGEHLDGWADGHQIAR